MKRSNPFNSNTEEMIQPSKKHKKDNEPIKTTESTDYSYHTSQNTAMISNTNTVNLNHGHDHHHSQLCGYVSFFILTPFFHRLHACTIHRHNKKQKHFKYESHPTYPDTKVISLIDTDNSDDDDMNNVTSDHSFSTRSVSATCSDSVDDLYQQDKKGYLVYVKGLVIMNKYKLSNQLGKGTFSRVFECYKIQNKQPSNNQKKQKYAIKVIRNVYKYQVAAKTELAVLNKIISNDPNNTSNCIHIVEHGTYRNHPILVFNLMGKSLYSFMNGHPFKHNDVIDLMWQIIVGVEFIHSLDIIITDLKPENILLCCDEIAIEHNEEEKTKYASPKSLKIKLIDFGSAVIDANNNKHTHLIQTRHYRAPEVVFKLEWSYYADIWSIGCILVELVHGKMLFNTHCCIDHINQMVKCIDSPPSNILSEIDEDTWKEYFDHHGALNMYKATRSPVQCKKLIKYFEDSLNDNQDCKQLYDLAKKMLVWYPTERITAKSALQHPAFKKYHPPHQKTQ